MYDVVVGHDDTGHVIFVLDLEYSTKVISKAFQAVARLGLRKMTNSFGISEITDII